MTGLHRVKLLIYLGKLIRKKSVVTYFNYHKYGLRQTLTQVYKQRYPYGKLCQESLKLVACVLRNPELYYVFIFDLILGHLNPTHNFIPINVKT